MFNSKKIKELEARIKLLEEAVPHNLIFELSKPFIYQTPDPFNHDIAKVAHKSKRGRPVGSKNKKKRLRPKFPNRYKKSSAMTN